MTGVRNFSYASDQLYYSASFISTAAHLSEILRHEEEAIRFSASLSAM
jgi:hypothetical protein